MELESSSSTISIMDPQIRKAIEETVVELLKNSDLTITTTSQVRKSASKKLGIDLSEQDGMKLVREIVHSYIESLDAEDESDDDNGDIIICRLSKRRRVTITKFKGKTLLSIREYYTKDGKDFPTSKGISLTTEQWSTFRNNIPAIEKGIKEMESMLN